MAKFQSPQILKTLEKVFNLGYKDEKSILKIDIEEILEKQEFSIQEMSIIVGLKRAIRSKEIIKFLSSSENDS